MVKPKETEAIMTTWNSDFIEAAAITLKLEHYQSGTSDVLRQIFLWTGFSIKKKDIIMTDWVMKDQNPCGSICPVALLRLGSILGHGAKG